jgi:hypothetical protein
MVLLNQTADDRTIRPGMELVSVNGHPVAELVKQFWAVTYADGDIETAKRHDIAKNFAKDYFWLVERPEYFTVRAIDPSSGKAVESKLAGVTDEQRKANHNSVNDAMLAGLAKVRGEAYKKLSLSFLKSFSTAADFCAVSHHLKRATFIGEETAGAYYGNNSGTAPTVTLPNSKVRFGLPTCGSWNAVSGYAGKRRGIIPDHVVVTKTVDLLRGVDAQLQLALTLAAKPRPD